MKLSLKRAHVLDLGPIKSDTWGEFDKISVNNSLF